MAFRSRRPYHAQCLVCRTKGKFANKMEVSEMYHFHLEECMYDLRTAQIPVFECTYKGRLWWRV